MFWRRQQSGTTVTTGMETATGAATVPTPVSEQPIGGQPAVTADLPEEKAIFDAVHAPATTEAETLVQEASAASAEAATTVEAETTVDEGRGKGKKAKDKAARRAAKAARKAEKAKGGGGAFGFGLVLGAALGAGAALLFAPKSGEEMRSELVEMGTGMRNQGGASDVDWRPTGSPWAGQAADAVQEAAASAETTLRDAAADAERTASDLKDDAEDRIQRF